MAIRPVQFKYLKNLLVVGQEAQIILALEKIHPSDLSVLFSDLNEDQIKKLVDCLFLVRKAGVALKEIPEFLLPDILEMIEDNKLALILTRLDPDDVVYILQKIPDTRVSVVLEQLDSKIRAHIERLLLYPKHSAGSRMNPVSFTVSVKCSVEEAIREIQSHAEREAIYYVYVVDEKRLVGVLSLKTLVITSPKTPVQSIMKSEVVRVNVNADQEEVAKLVSQYNLFAVPVVNDNEELLGVIAIDDVLDIFEEEATEDIYNMAGLSGEDRAFTPVSIKIKKRLPWLSINTLTAFSSTLIITQFSSLLEQHVILAALMPVVSALAGNGGTQSMVVITRSIALGEIEFSRALPAIGREVLNGLALGLIIGFLSALLLWAFHGEAIIGIVFFMAMTINLFVGGLLGSSVPLLLKRLGLDPAIGAGIFVTAATDFTGFLIFLGLARHFLSI